MHALETSLGAVIVDTLVAELRTLKMYSAEAGPMDEEDEEQLEDLIDSLEVVIDYCDKRITTGDENDGQ